MEKIAIIGAGYVGLTTAACFAKMGHRVILSEIDPGKRDHIRNGISPILEPGLAEILAEVTASGHLSVTSDNFEAASSSDFVFICLPTPQAFDGSADTSVIFDVIRSIASAFTPNTVLITKSTMPVGSVKTIQDLVHDTGAIVATNPEFLREGTAVDDTLHPERIVIGCNDGQSADRITELYASLESQIFVTDPQSAELIKYASNAFLATKVTFINSVATLCDAVGADIASVSCALGSDSRIGSKFLTPGPGWGGSCFPKDTSALLHLSDRIGHSFKLLDAVISGNLDHQLGVVQQIVNVLGENGGNRVAVLGLTFKAGTDDLRDSPAIFIIRQLLKLGIIVTAYDPTVTTELHASLDSVNICFSAKQAAVSADLIVVLTEWPEFSELDPSDLMSVMANRNIFDTRGIINKETWISSGFSVRILGRP